MMSGEPIRCFVCEKHQLGDAAEGGVLFADDLIYVGHVHTLRGPTAYRGHLVVEPRRHVAGLGDLDASEASALGQASSQMAHLLEIAQGAEHVYMYVAGDGMAHLHVHLVPRYPGTPRAYWGPAVTRWPDAPRVDPEGMRTLISGLRDQRGLV